MQASSLQRLAPPAAAVPGNRYDTLEVPPLGAVPAGTPVSVVLPHYESPAALALTLSGLAAQTYPASLLQVIVVDDGSTVPPTVADDLQVEVVTQHRDGFGAGRARNLGASLADGEVLVFVDCDMVPEPGFVEAHLRWHDAVSDAVTIGMRRHVDFDGISPADVRRAAAQGTLAPLLAGREQQTPEFVDFHLQRTRQLLSDDDDLFRVVASGNLGLRADTFTAAGGFDERFRQWGGEDTELGYRLFVDGCLLVPEWDALCWHQGLPGHLDEGKLASLHDQRATMAHLVAHRGFRRSVTGRSYERPRVVVTVEVGDEPAETVAESVEAVLASAFHDLAVCLALPSEHPGRAWLERQFGPDPRVTTAARIDPFVRHPHSPVHLRVPARARLGPHTAGELLKRLERTEPAIGLLHVTVPGTSPRDCMVRAYTSRAWSRGQRVAAARGAPSSADDRTVEQVAGELFGEQWVAGSAVGVGASGERGAGPTGAPLAAANAPAELSVATLQRMVASLHPRHRRLLLRTAHRSLAVLVALRGLRRARTWPERRVATRRLALAALPQPLATALRVLVWRPYRRLRGARRAALPAVTGQEEG